MDTTFALHQMVKRLFQGNLILHLEFGIFSTGKQLGLFGSYTLDVNAIKVTLDGKYVISGSRECKSVKVREFATDKLLFNLNGHTDHVTTVNVIPNGMIIVSGARDSKIKIWETSTGEMVRSIDAHSACVSSLCVLPDNEHIVSSSYDGTVKIWNIYDGTGKTLFWNDCPIFALSISKDGVWLTASDQKGRVWIFEWMNNEYRESKLLKPTEEIIETPKTDRTNNTLNEAIDII